MIVLVVAHIGETYGHLARALSVAQVLRGEGVDVHIACAPKARWLVTEAAPMKLHYIPWDWSHNEIPSPLTPDYLDRVEASNRALADVIKIVRPDLMLSFPGVFTAQLASGLGIPHIAVLHGPYLSPIVALADASPVDRKVLDFATQIMTGGPWDLVLRHLSISLDLPRLTYSEFLERERILIPQPGLPVEPRDNLQLCDFIPASLGPPLPRGIEVTKDTCYVTFGTGNPCDLGAIVRCAREMFSLVIVSSGDGETRFRDGVFCAPLIASSSLAGSVGLVITHGGIGTVGTFASHGTPLVIIPTEVDQATMAMHARRIGIATEYGLDEWARHPRLGRHLPTIDPESLHTKLSQARRSVKLRPEITAGRGNEEAARHVLAWASTMAS